MLLMSMAKYHSSTVLQDSTVEYSTLALDLYFLRNTD